MDKQRLLELFERYLDNRCTDEELEALLRYFGDSAARRPLKELILMALQSETDESLAQRSEVKEALRQTDTYFANLTMKEPRAFPRRFVRYFRYGIAATLLFACAVGGYVYRYEMQQMLSKKPARIADAYPATDKAVLTLSDGRKITLDGTEGKSLLEDEGVAITKTADGRLIYASRAASPLKSVYNEIATPKGGQYQILLPDGSKVWLNAASTLKYPTRFSESGRVVELEGEAYFEVRSMKRKKASADMQNMRVPFIVKTRGQDIEVVGTQFNVSAYVDESVTKTTLAEGSVRISLPGKGSPGNDFPPPVLLTPGQQAASTRSDMQVRSVDVESELAWKNGYFAFNNMLLIDIIKRLSRWYDVEISDTEVPSTRYTVYISRQVKLSHVLEMLEKAGNLRFALNKTNHIVITPKEMEEPM